MKKWKLNRAMRKAAALKASKVVPLDSATVASLAFIKTGIDAKSAKETAIADREARRADDELAALTAEQDRVFQEKERELEAMLANAKSKGFTTQRRSAIESKDTGVLPFILTAPSESADNAADKAEAKKIEAELLAKVAEQDQLMKEKEEQHAEMVAKMAKKGYTINHKHHKAVMVNRRASFILSGVEYLNRPAANLLEGIAEGGATKIAPMAIAENADDMSLGSYGSKMEDMTPKEIAEAAAAAEAKLQAEFEEAEEVRACVRACV